MGQQYYRLVHVAHVVAGQDRLIGLDVLDLVGAGEVPMVDHDELGPVDILVEADFADAPPR